MMNNKIGFFTLSVYSLMYHVCCVYFWPTKIDTDYMHRLHVRLFKKILHGKFWTARNLIFLFIVLNLLNKKLVDKL